MSDTVLRETIGRVALLTINRPDKLNALNAETRAALIDRLDEAASDDAVRVVVITGAGEKAFVAGADIREFGERTPVEQYQVMNQRTVFEAVASLAKPVIAMINGYCLGGGCELALACDIRIASSKAKLGQPEVNLGLLPGGGGTQRLPRLVGAGVAARLLFSGEIIRAEEALRIGMVDEVVEPDALRTTVLGLADVIADKSPVALRLIKQAIRAAANTPLNEGLRLEKTLFGLAFSSEDKAEGVAAFLEKREADFKGH